MLREAGFQFRVETRDTDESYPADLEAAEVAAYIARKKAAAFEQIPDRHILITADTVVKVDKNVLGKPANRDEAFDMIRLMSARSHEVITGVTLKSSTKEITFSHTTKVYFRALSDQEIYYYIDEYQPFDKAGAYGIQEWLGMVGITRIEGSYFNVVGLPIHALHEALHTF